MRRSLRLTVINYRNTINYSLVNRRLVMVDRADQSRRLRHFSRVMAWITGLGIVLIAAATCLIFMIPEWTRGLLLARLGTAGAELQTTPDRVLLGAAVTAIPVGVMLYGLWRVRALFLDFAEGMVFTLATARRLRDFAVTVLAQALLGPLSSTALLIAFTISNPPGSRQLGIALSVNDYIALIVGSVLLAVAWVMAEATRIAEENASIV
ncbi:MULTISPECIES: DUF2975 domain-containing protein [unclassified Bradyrhizobium]|uniref:DUF2975 domain-containing protein n=2 Tax=unclassified Bradyrhizobium TaxID=2631580 RepID=UPI0028E8E859|nr:MULTISPECIES: DUF2975 domain-containing protein [unclassified Bradyrhizobium]